VTHVFSDRHQYLETLLTVEISNGCANKCRLALQDVADGKGDLHELGIGYAIRK
jgi:hypothetical protein